MTSICQGKRLMTQTQQLSTQYSDLRIQNKQVNTNKQVKPHQRAQGERHRISGGVRLKGHIRPPWP